MLYVAGLALIVLMVMVLYVAGKLAGGGKITRIDQQVVQKNWGKIEELLASNEIDHLKQAVLEADKTMDFVLEKLYPRSSAMGERLKLAREKFNENEYDNLWYAHKIRNNITHEMGFELSSEEAQNAVAIFRKALISLGMFG